MSVASEFAPEVYIPERARRGQPRVRHLALVAPTSTAVDLELCSPSRLCVEEVTSAVTPLRLTRRGKLALVLATAVTGALLLLVAHASQGQAPRSAAPAAGASGVVVVQNGDTLWSIAQRIDPKADPRQIVDRLRRSNHLTSIDLSPGQTLKLD